MPAIDPTTFFEDPQYGKLIPLTKGYFAMVDEEDHERLSVHNWCAFTPTSGKYIYAIRYVCEGHTVVEVVFMHREILSPDESSDVDHKNSNGLDNRKRNIRICTRMQNCQNRRKEQSDRILTSKYKGVHFKVYPSGLSCWKAEITFRCKKIVIGSFDDEEDAAMAYDREARVLFGEFSRTNFPEDDGRVLVKKGRVKIDKDAYDKAVVLIGQGKSNPEIAKMFDVDPAQISRIRNGHTQRPLA